MASAFDASAAVLGRAAVRAARAHRPVKPPRPPRSAR